MSNLGTTRKPLASASRLAAPSSRLTAPATSRLAKPAAKSTVPMRPATANSTRNTSVSTISNDSSMGSIADSDISSIQGNETIRNVSSSTSIGSISMSRTSSIGSRATSMNRPQKASNRYDTYSIHNEHDKSKSNSNGTDIVKNIEDVIARNKILEEENNVLKNLIHEENDKTDRFDERRILMLKCQVYQLEKQINILSKSLAFRKTAHTEALNTMAILSDTFRSMIQNAESRGLSPVKTLSIERSEFIRWTEMAESTRLKLIKTEDSTMNDENIKDMSEQSLLTTKFSKNASVDILDVCSGNLNHVNLKQIGQLESEMSQLYKKMVRLKESLQTNLNDVSTHSDGPKQNRSNVLPMHKENLKTQLFDCCNATKDTCASLFDLMLLVPSAPWPAVKKSPIDKLTQEKLITKLKSLGLPKTKYPQVEMLFKSYFVASNYHHHMRSNELAAAEEEIKFYRASYAAQRDYIESVMNLFMKKYEGFIEELRDNLNVPLRSLIDKFWQMKSDSTEENLKEFLGIFKHYAKKLDMVISNIESMPANDLISKTFNDLIGQLDLQVTSLSNLCQNGLEQLNLNKIDLTELSNQSDLIFSEVISLTPKTSPSHSPSASVNNLANF